MNVLKFDNEDLLTFILTQSKMEDEAKQGGTINFNW